MVNVTAILPWLISKVQCVLQYFQKPKNKTGVENSKKRHKLRFDKSGGGTIGVWEGTELIASICPYDYSGQLNKDGLRLMVSVLSHYEVVGTTFPRETPCDQSCVVIEIQRPQEQTSK